MQNSSAHTEVGDEERGERGSALYNLTEIFQ